MRNALRPSAVVACSIAILCCSVAARAQSLDSGYDPGANQTVNTLAVQPDGKTIVGGDFTGLGAGIGTTTRNHIGRLNADGTVDPSFNPGTDGPVLAVAVQPDGKILAGGTFNKAGGGTGLTSLRSHIARFNADGTVDTGFDPGVSGNVWALAVQSDGKILVGGEFSKLGGGGSGVTTRNGIGRLNADGTIDPGFNPGVTKATGVPIVYTMALQADGQIVVGGYFNGVGGVTRNYIARIDAGGIVDGAFNPGASSISGVNALALQADGKILVGGSFTGLGAGTGGTNRANIGRLNTDGSVDSFNPGAEAQVLTLGVQTDGKILAGGYFKWLGAAGGPARSVRNYIGRINADGSVDAGFDPSANNVVNAVAVQGDGAIVIGGIFDHLGVAPNLTGGTLRNRIARITNTAGIQTLTLSSNDTVVTWARSGGGPEVSRVTFELSIGAAAYTLLGSGTRVAGGWTLSGLGLPRTRIRLRAQGYYETGEGSGSIVESILSQGRATEGDYDGDGKADLVVFRPSSGTWYTLQSLASTVSAVPFGLSADVPVPGDYDGDGSTDLAVYRPSSGTWYFQQSTAGFTAVQFGLSGDVPVPADYDGDRKTDIAVYRPSTGEWFILQSSTVTVATATAGATGDVPVPADYDGDGKADVAVFRPSTGEWFIRSSISSNFTSYQFGLTGDVPVPGDYGGDGKADIAVYRPSTGVWYVPDSTTGYTTSVNFQWGLSGDIAEPGDYDGDGRTDLAVYRPSNGTWYIRQSTTSYGTAVITQFGLPGDTAAPGAVIANAIAGVRPVSPLANLTPFNDFDGDGKADLTVYRPPTGTWFNLKSGTNYTTFGSTQFGLSGDIPVPGDYDGDRKADIAVYRPSGGTWYILKSSDSTFSAQQWGLAGDIPVPGDYDGDGKIDVAVYRPSSGTWYILKSSNSTFSSQPWGLSGDVPVSGDYDGDGLSDPAVWRPSTGEWFILRSTTNYATFLQFQWGLSGDIAVPGDYDGDGKTDLGVWRPSSGTWFVSQSTTSLIQQWGLPGDIPVEGDYDGDGKSDLAVFRPSTGFWFIRQSSSGFTTVASYQWGLTGDIPIVKRP
jgi:uncharacterized delta-60 repeat protein